MKKIPIGIDIDILYKINGVHTKEEYSNWIKDFKDCGFSYFNFDFGYSKNCPLKEDTYLEWANSVKEALSENNAKCTIVHEPVNDFFDVENEFSVLRKRAFEACRIIDIPWIVAHPKEYVGNYNKAEMKKIFDDNYEYFARATEEAEKNGIGLTVETMTPCYGLHHNGSKRHFGDDPYDLIRLVDKVGSDKFKICLDIGHLNNNPLFDIGDTVRDFGSRLKTLHIHDNDAIYDQHYLPYMGNIDWKKFIDALKEINYDGVFTYEATKIPNKYPKPLRKSCVKFMHDIAEYIVNL